MRLMSRSVLVFLILYCAFFASMINAAEKSVGRVVWVKGSFIAVGANHAKRSLERAGIFYEKDTLVTDASSQAEIVFSDNSLMTLREGTTFRVDQYNYNPASKSGSYVMSLAEGGFRTVTGVIAAAQPDNYKIKTPVATIGVRGTEFVVYYKNGRLYVGRIKGKPCIYDPIKHVQICLTPAVPYVIVIGGEGADTSTDMPDELRGSVDLEIVTAYIQQSIGGISGNTPAGQVSGFCVQ